MDAPFGGVACLGSATVLAEPISKGHGRSRTTEGIDHPSGGSKRRIHGVCVDQVVKTRLGVEVLEDQCGIDECVESSCGDVTEIATNFCKCVVADEGPVASDREPYVVHRIWRHMTVTIRWHEFIEATREEPHRQIGIWSTRRSAPAFSEVLKGKVPQVAEFVDVDEHATKCHPPSTNRPDVSNWNLIQRCADHAHQRLRVESSTGSCDLRNPLEVTIWTGYIGEVRKSILRKWAHQELSGWCLVHR